MVRILPSSCRLIGTSANLIPGDILSVWELLHGMMLPSGNDAAQSLAIHFGLIILKDKYKTNVNSAIYEHGYPLDLIKRIDSMNYTHLD